MGTIFQEGSVGQAAKNFIFLNARSGRLLGKIVCPKLAGKFETIGDIIWAVLDARAVVLHMENSGKMFVHLLRLHHGINIVPAL